MSDEPVPLGFVPLGAILFFCHSRESGNPDSWIVRSQPDNDNRMNEIAPFGTARNDWFVLINRSICLIV
jgi:hypothetical protein